MRCRPARSVLLFLRPHAVCCCLHPRHRATSSRCVLHFTPCHRECLPTGVLCSHLGLWVVSGAAGVVWHRCGFDMAAPALLQCLRRDRHISRSWSQIGGKARRWRRLHEFQAGWWYFTRVLALVVVLCAHRRRWRLLCTTIGLLPYLLVWTRPTCELKMWPAVSKLLRVATGSFVQVRYMRCLRLTCTHEVSISNVSCLCGMLFAADDGGYVLLAVPPRSTPAMFSGITWSAACTGMQQVDIWRRVGCFAAVV